MMREVGLEGKKSNLGSLYHSYGHIHVTFF